MQISYVSYPLKKDKSHFLCTRERSMLVISSAKITLATLELSWTHFHLQSLWVGKFLFCAKRESFNVKKWQCVFEKNGQYCSTREHSFFSIAVKLCFTIEYRTRYIVKQTNKQNWKGQYLITRMLRLICFLKFLIFHAQERTFCKLLDLLVNYLKMKHIVTIQCGFHSVLLSKRTNRR